MTPEQALTVAVQAIVKAFVAPEPSAPAAKPKRARKRQKRTVVAVAPRPIAPVQEELPLLGEEPLDPNLPPLINLSDIERMLTEKDAVPPGYWRKDDEEKETNNGWIGMAP